MQKWCCGSGVLGRCLDVTTASPLTDTVMPCHACVIAHAGAPPLCGDPGEADTGQFHPMVIYGRDRIILSYILSWVVYVGALVSGELCFWAPP